MNLKSTIDPKDLQEKAKGMARLFYSSSRSMQNLFKKHPELYEVKDKVERKAKRIADELFVSSQLSKTLKEKGRVLKEKALKAVQSKNAKNKFRLR